MANPLNHPPQEHSQTDYQPDQLVRSWSPFSGRPVGVIDIGSNSIRLVVYERLSRSPTPLFNEKVLAGLGAGVTATGALDDGAIEKARAAVRRFSALAWQIGVERLDVMATAAAREASNGEAFIKEIEAICESPVRVLTGYEEAELAGFGALCGIPQADGVTGDMGGGSLELIQVAGGEIGRGETHPLGGLRLQTLSDQSVKSARQLARSTLAGSAVLGELRDRDFYAIGGTWRSLAKLHMRQCGYPLNVMHQYKLDPGELSEFCKSLMRSSLETIEGIEVVSKQRQALLPYGAAVLYEVIRAGIPKAIVISALGLREGLLYSQLTAEQRAEDPLLVAANELSMLRSRFPAHAEELIEWTAEAMEALGFSESEEEARLRSAACLLADIGWRAHPEYRGEQSLNIISHAAFVGLDHPGRAYLALAVYYRHSGLSDDDLGAGLRELAPIRFRERARALAACFRVAYLISGSVPGVVNRTRIQRAGDRLQLVLPGDLAVLEGGRLSSRLKSLAALGDLGSETVIE